MEDSLAFGELRNGAKTKAGPLEAEQQSRLRIRIGNISQGLILTSEASDNNNSG